jgi:hypothetical protein
MITPESLERLRGAPLPTVRHHVRQILEQTPSFRALAADERKNIANSMVNVMAYMVHPSGGDDRLDDVARRTDAAQTAQALADPLRNDGKVYDAKITSPTLPGSRGQVGNQMEGNLAGKAGEAMAKMVKDVDFPKFVSSLIEGVFTSIVNSSIKQMHEFGKYLQAVAMTVKDFAAENVHPDEARENLVNRNPQALELDNSGGRRRVRRRSGASDEAMPDFRALFGMMDDVDIDDDEDEAKIVESQQLQMARQRQQMLATMVLMGINRIVVTDGEIKATVTFDVSSHEAASSELTGSTSDVQTHRDTASEHAYQSNRNLWGTDRSGSSSGRSAVNTRVASATSGIDEKSDAYMDAKAKLTGFVQVKFKSETFPLERLASATELQAVQENSRR